MRVNEIRGIIMDQLAQTQWHRFLTTNYYTFGKPEQPPYTTTMRLADDGSVQGYHQFNERYWALDDDELVLLNANKEATTRFELPATPADIAANQLLGRYLGASHTVHRLLIRPMLAELNTELNQTHHDLQKQAQRLTDHLERIEHRVYQKVVFSHRIRVVFILNSIETLPALQPLITRLRDDSRFEIKLVAVDKMFGFFQSLHTLKALKAGLDAQNLPYIALTGDYAQAGERLHTWQADYIVRQSEWDGDYPKAFSGIALDWARLIHIPYTITEGGVYTPKKQESMLTNGYYEHIWRYFAPDPLTDQEQQDIASTFISPEAFVTAGSMKAQAIAHATPTWPLNHPGNKRVVWMAHHSIETGWFQMGMLAWAQAHPDIDIVYNPHPLLREKVADPNVKELTPKMYDQFLKDWNALDNTAILINHSQYETTAAADVILTDGLSSFYEMQIQHKPVVGLLRKDHIAFTPLGDRFMTGVHTCEDFETAQATVLKLLTEPDDLYDRQTEICANWLKYPNPDKFIRDEMIKEIQSGAKRA
jgi:hypothetical protein